MAVRVTTDRPMRPTYTPRPPVRAMRGEGVGSRDRAVKRRRMWRWIVAVLSLSLVSLLHVWSRVAVIHVRYDLAAAESRQKELRKQVAQLEGRIGSLLAVDRLIAIAGTQLHMAPPQPQQIVMVQSAVGAPP